VLEEARRILDSGLTEIQLLGQNVNSYCDPLGRRSFAELLAEVGQLPGIRRVRFMTSHPRHFTREIVEAIDSVPTLCDHVHLPVQSGSSRVLAAMAREYTREQDLERVAWIRAATHKSISMTTDIIVGFPGETAADFEETMTLLEQVQFDAVFSFKYSPRPNTPAITMENAIPEEEKTYRLAILNDRQREIQRVSYVRHVGQVLEAMVEGYQSARDQVTGRTSQNKTLNFTVPEGTPVPPVGSYVQVRVVRAHPNSLVGEMVCTGQTECVREANTVI
jgi:tRNA-2-methylthio-N6-dimethylallyladenosine synthase